jgi:hypothetical protein
VLTKKAAAAGLTNRTGGNARASRIHQLLQNPIYLALFGGGRGIRTPGTLPGTVVFKTTAIDHSAIPPRRKLGQNSRDFVLHPECASHSPRFGPNRSKSV